ncbi:MAG: AbrB/MazE/SpoVT family DNA-binding domain-containing protein [Candidatus Sulfotelmatobacter sp.]
MSHFSTISSKGRLTVPQEIRKRLGLEPGDRVEFVMEEDRTVIRPDRSKANPFEKFIGIADPFPGGEEGIKAWIDDMRSDEAYE